MFGVVPKTLWSKRTPADDENRILLGLNTVIVRTGQPRVLIETGIGNKQTAEDARHPPQSGTPPGLPCRCRHSPGRGRRTSSTPICTSTTAAGTPRFTPMVPSRPPFPTRATSPPRRARPWAPATRARPRQLSRRQLRSADRLRPDDADRPRQRRRLHAHDSRLAATLSHPHPDQRTKSSPASPSKRSPATPAACSASTSSAGHHACYIGDLIPTHHHLDPTWVMGYDLDPLTCIAARKRFLARAIPERWLVLFTHDHQVPAATLQWNDKGKPTVRDQN